MFVVRSNNVFNLSNANEFLLMVDFDFQRNPKVPTLHFNYRYFEVFDSEQGKKHWWFGGGTDLTPYFLDKEVYLRIYWTIKNLTSVISVSKLQGVDIKWWTSTLLDADSEIFARSILFT